QKQSERRPIGTPPLSHVRLGLPSVHLHCRTGRPVVASTTTLGLPGRSYLGRLPRLVARGYPVAVSAPLAWYVIHFYDGSIWLGRASRDQFVIFIVLAVHMPRCWPITVLVNHGAG